HYPVCNIQFQATFRSLPFYFSLHREQSCFLSTPYVLLADGSGRPYPPRVFCFFPLSIIYIII
ncbi:MAG TPA: hypothetical protein PKJ95_06250, partial [Atribacterota bacterium]|nr:hypothetical protein [Atribacterota bacterium]